MPTTSSKPKPTTDGPPLGQGPGEKDGVIPPYEERAPVTPRFPGGAGV